MSEAVVKKRQGMIISSIEENSPAAYAMLKIGDNLISVDGHLIGDIVDFRYHSAESEIQLTVERDGLTLHRKITRNYGEEIGISFESELAEEIHTCENKCVFCFIHQMPKGMRKSLYLMDDDYRLSFLHGNYVTLTNMSEEEFSRVLEQKLSPLYVSVHASDPALRGFMLGKKEPQPVLPRLRILAEHGIEVHAQIVLCPGFNDGAALERTIEDLANLHPVTSGLRAGVSSVAIVPVGLSKYRQKLYPLKNVDSDYAKNMISLMEQKNKDLRKQLGTRFVFLSDEWFFLADQPMPSRQWYEDFPQLEDGVGTCRLFLDEAANLSRKLPTEIASPFNATLLTSELAGGVVKTFADRLNQITNLNLDVCVVKNQFFGGNVNVAGLITAQDILSSLKERSVKNKIIIPSICLREDYLFLDDLTVDDLKDNCGLDVTVVEPKPRALWNAIELEASSE